MIDGYTEIGAGAKFSPLRFLGVRRNIPVMRMSRPATDWTKMPDREHVTMHPGTAIDKMETVVGDNGLFCRVHVAHGALLEIMSFLRIMQRLAACENR